MESPFRGSVGVPDGTVHPDHLKGLYQLSEKVSTNSDGKVVLRRAVATQKT